MKHESHPDVDLRLARISGHIEGIRKMIAQEKTCCEILQQMKAVISALKQARRIVVLDHARHCIADAIEAHDTRTAIDDLEQIISQIL